MPNIIVDGTIKINSVSINWSIGIGTNWVTWVAIWFSDKFKFKYTKLFSGERTLDIGPTISS